MAILNNYTNVPPERTVSEITKMLASKGAQRVIAEFDAQGKNTGLLFTLKLGGVSTEFRLPINQTGVARVLAKGGKPSVAQIRRAEWVAWRIMKDWVEAQLAIVESLQAELGQVFMPYALAESDGCTMYQHLVENNQRKLGAGAS